MIATYDNLNSHIAKHNDYVDYSSQNKTKTQKTTNHIAKRKKYKNTSNFDYIVLGMIYGFFITILAIGYGSWLMELI
nr:MAG TPA: hypothetical protein [Caudoviricetes sp.]